MPQPAALRTAVFFTALPEEAKAVLAYLDASSSITVENHVFETGHVVLDDGTRWRIAVVELGPGNVETAGVVAPAASHFKPAVMFFSGIAGAIKDDDVNIGDVVAGSSISWTERAKVTDAKRFDRVVMANAPAFITSVARKVARQGDWVARLPENVDQVGRKAVVGQIASGEEVVAGEERKAEIRVVHSDAIAIENEGYGFMRANDQAAGSHQYLVVRGVCDKADAAKDDDHHVLAAQTAAAFAIETLNVFSRLDTAVSDTEAVPQVPTTPDGAPDALMAIFTEFLTDEDIVGDDQGEVDRYTSNLIVRDGFNLDEGLVQVLGRLNESPSQTVGRRLEWVARALIGADVTGLTVLESDEFYRFVNDHEKGAARALLHPDVWASLPTRIRRRLLTAVIGTRDEPEMPDALGTRLLVPVVAAGLLDDGELERFRASVRDASYSDLAIVGMPVELLIPRMIEDLRSGEFERQNPAARHLYRSEEERGESAAINPYEDATLGAALVTAAPKTYPSNGAKEALQVPRLIGWSVSRLAGGIWASVTRNDGQDLDWPPSPRLNNLIVAATAKDVLPQVLDVARTLFEANTQDSNATTTEMLVDSLNEIGAELTGDDRAAFAAFVDWLSEKGR